MSLGIAPPQIAEDRRESKSDGWLTAELSDFEEMDEEFDEEDFDDDFDDDFEEELDGEYEIEADESALGPEFATTDDDGFEEEGGEGFGEDDKPSEPKK